MGHATDHLEQIAKVILEKEPSLNWADAYDRAAQANPDLYAKAVNEPTDMSKAVLGNNPMARDEAKCQLAEESTRLEKSQTSDEAEELDFLARKLAAETGDSYYDAYEAVAKLNPELYERAVNGGVTEQAHPYLKMLQRHEEILSQLEAEGSAVDQGAKERVRDDVIRVREAISSGVFDSEPKIMEAMRKVSDLLLKVESNTMTGSELNTELSKLADDLSDDLYLELDHLIAGKQDNFGDLLIKVKGELHLTMTEGQIENCKVVKWLETKAAMTQLVA